MAFNRAVIRTPVSIGRMVIRLTDVPETSETVDGPDGPETVTEAAWQSAQFELVVEYDDGTTERRAGNLAPHITTAQRDALMQFLSNLRAQAETQILPSQE
jgi:hypothetical protein